MITPKIAVLGGINMDFTIRCQVLPQPGQTVQGSRLLKAPGGKGANQAVAAARLGAHVTLIGSVGDDGSGRELLDSMRKVGIDTSVVRSTTGLSTGTAFILVDDNGRNLISFVSGANSTVDRSLIDAAEEAIRDADLFLLQMECPMDAVQYGIEKASDLGVTVILNPAPAYQLPEAILRKCAVVVPNETEAQILSGVSISSDHDLAKAARAIKERGAGTVIITVGERGAYLSDAGAEGRLFAPPKVKSVDTVTAGDVFAGALAVKLAAKDTIEGAIAFANCAAALSTTREGAQPSIPNEDEVRDFQRHSKGKGGFSEDDRDSK